MSLAMWVSGMKEGKLGICNPAVFHKYLLANHGQCHQKNYFKLKPSILQHHRYLELSHFKNKKTESQGFQVIFFKVTQIDNDKAKCIQYPHFLGQFGVHQVFIYVIFFLFLAWLRWLETPVRCWNKVARTVIYALLLILWWRPSLFHH